MTRITKQTQARAKSAERALIRAGRKTRDSFQNFGLNLGQGTDNALSGSTYGFNPISRNRTLLEWIHRGSWMGGVAVDTVAEDMTRAGIDVVCDNPPEEVHEIQELMTTLGVWPNITDTCKWSRLYGGSIGVMMVDGQNVSTPLDPNKVGRDQFRGVLPMDRWMVEPSLNDLVTEQGPHIGLPKFYSTASNTSGYRFEKIHYTRVIRLEGIRLPYWQRVSENLWGISVLERLYDRMVAFDSATTGTAQMAYKSHVRTYKIEGLREIIGVGGEALNTIYAYVDMMRRFQGIEGITLIDSKDELAVMAPANMTGMSEALLQFGQQLSGALGIPLVRLFGQSPAGLNSTGESDLRTYYDGIAQQQASNLLVPMKSIVKMSALSLGIKLKDDFTVVFRPLWQLSEEQKSEVSSRDAESILKAEERGVISQQTALQELKTQSKTTGRFSNITDEDVEAASDELAPRGEEALQQQMDLADAQGGDKGGDDEQQNDAQEPELSEHLNLDAAFLSRTGDTVIQLIRRVVGDSKNFEEGKHPRGQPDNSGQFSKGGGNGSKSKSKKVDTSKASKSYKEWANKANEALGLETAKERKDALLELQGTEPYDSREDGDNKISEAVRALYQEAWQEHDKEEKKNKKNSKKKLDANKLEDVLEASGGFGDSYETPEDRIQESKNFLEANPEYQKMGIEINGLACLQTYVSDGYKKINKSLRSGKDLSSAEKTFVSNVNETLDKLPPHEGEVYRLAKLSPEILANFEPGKTFVDSAFLSSSRYENFLEGETGEYQAAHNTDIIIASKTGRNVGPLNPNLSEGEVLFKAGTRFKVKSITKSGRRNKIEMEEVDNDQGDNDAKEPKSPKSARDSDPDRSRDFLLMLGSSAAKTGWSVEKLIGEMTAKGYSDSERRIALRAFEQHAKSSKDADRPRTGSRNVQILHCSVGEPSGPALCGNSNYYMSAPPDEFRETASRQRRPGDVYLCRNCARKLGLVVQDSEDPPVRSRDSLPVSQWMGLDVGIETLRGQVRSGADWEAVQPADYGYIRRMPSAEGPMEWMDCYLSADRVQGDAYVVDGYEPGGAFDEHKVMLGYADRQSALRDFHAAYGDGRRAGGVTSMSVDRLRAWMESGDVTRPLADRNLRLAANG